MGTRREEQRGRLRPESPPRPDVLVVRGGPESLPKLRIHAARTAKAWCLDGQPLFGISVFCALDDIGPASLSGLCTGRLATYRMVHVCRVADLAAADVELLPSGGRPHFTAVIGSDQDERLLTLLATFGPTLDNRGRSTIRRRPGR